MSNNSSEADVTPKYFLRSRKRSFENSSVSREGSMNRTPEKETVVISSSDEDVCKETPKESDVACSVESQLECAICLQICVHPARLPCRHIFCFLCLKGVIHGSKCCAMCRQPIPLDYLENPDLVQVPSGKTKLTNQGDDYKWFYEGRNGGWWQFEDRMSEEIDENHQKGFTSFEMLICGKLYVVDVQQNVQYLKARPSQRRKIIRDLPSRVAMRKGVAGIR